MKRNNHCCKSVHAGISFLGMGTWLILTAIAVMTPTIAHEPLPEQYATLFRMLWAIGVAAIAAWRISILQRLLMYYLPQKHILIRLGLLLMAFLLPVLEVHCMIKLGWRRGAVVPNFWCDYHKTAGLNAPKLAEGIAEGIREKYFATVGDDDPPGIIISTNTGTLVSLLIRESSLYMFVLLSEEGRLPMNIELASDSSWLVEKSSDGQSGALVCELFFAPCFAETDNAESDLAKIVIDLLGELEKGGY